MREVQLGLTSRQALQTKFASFPNIDHCPNENTIARRFNRSFENRAGKDSLQVIKEGGEGISSYFSFLEPGVPAIDLESLPLSSIAPMRSGSCECHKSVHRERDEKERAAAKLIWKNWVRGCKRQEFFKTPYGQAISYIGRLCKEVIVERPPLYPREIIARKAVLFDRGTSLYRCCERIKEKYSEVKRVVIQRRGKAAEEQDVQLMQVFQRQWEILSAMGEPIQMAGILHEKNWENLRVNSEALGKRIDEALEALKVIDAELEMMKQDTYKDLC